MDEMLGAISLIVMSVVCVSGVFLKYKRKPLLTIHRFAGYSALVLAVCHGVLAAIS